MSDQSSDPASVLIVRLWIEQEHQSPLRARVTRTLGSTKGEHSVGVASSGEEICGMVRDWVLAFTDLHPAAGDGHVKVAGDDQPS